MVQAGYSVSEGVPGNLKKDPWGLRKVSERFEIFQSVSWDLQGFLVTPRGFRGDPGDFQNRFKRFRGLD